MLGYNETSGPAQTTTGFFQQQGNGSYLPPQGLGSGPTQKAEQPSGVNASIAQLEKRAVLLKELVETLTNRLDNVLHAPSPAAVSAGQKPPTSDVPIVNFIDAVDNILIDIISRVNSIHQRLAI